MYNGVGLLTPRGSGTSGHIQSNSFNVRGGFERRGRPPDDPKKGARVRKPNEKILEHQRKREIALELVEQEEKLEAAGWPEDDIQKALTDLRAQLEAEFSNQSREDQVERLKDKEETHAKAKRKQEELKTFARALAIDNKEESSTAAGDGGAPVAGAEAPEKLADRFAREQKELEELLLRQEEEEIEQAREALRDEAAAKKRRRAGGPGAAEERRPLDGEGASQHGSRGPREGAGRAVADRHKGDEVGRSGRRSEGWHSDDAAERGHEDMRERTGQRVRGSWSEVPDRELGGRAGRSRPEVDGDDWRRHRDERHRDERQEARRSGEGGTRWRDQGEGHRGYESHRDAGGSWHRDDVSEERRCADAPARHSRPRRHAYESSEDERGSGRKRARGDESFERTGRAEGSRQPRRGDWEERELEHMGHGRQRDLEYRRGGRRREGSAGPEGPREGKGTPEGSPQQKRRDPSRRERAVCDKDDDSEDDRLPVRSPR